MTRTKVKPSVADDVGSETTTMRIAVDLRDLTKAVAKAQGMTLVDYVDRLLRQELNRLSKGFGVDLQELMALAQLSASHEPAKQDDRDDQEHAYIGVRRRTQARVSVIAPLYGMQRNDFATYAIEKEIEAWEKKNNVRLDLLKRPEKKSVSSTGTPKRRA